MQIERLPPLVTTLEPSNHPYLNGAWTPLQEEVDATDLEVVEGAIPTDIDNALDTAKKLCDATTALPVSSWISARSAEASRTVIPQRLRVGARRVVRRPTTATSERLLLMRAARRLRLVAVPT